MLPDLVAEFEAMGMTASDLDPLMSSADGYVTLWEKAFNLAAPNRDFPMGLCCRTRPEPST